MVSEMTTGRMRRLCPDCGVEIEVARPEHAASVKSSGHQRRDYAAAIRGQICWEAVRDCSACLKFWNELVRRAGEPIKARED